MDVIASEAKQSLYCSKTRDCHGPSGLAMTTSQIICDRAPVNHFDFQEFAPGGLLNFRKYYNYPVEVFSKSC